MANPVAVVPSLDHYETLINYPSESELLNIMDNSNAGIENIFPISQPCSPPFLNPQGNCVTTGTNDPVIPNMVSQFNGGNSQTGIILNPQVNCVTAGSNDPIITILVDEFHGGNSQTGPIPQSDWTITDTDDLLIPNMDVQSKGRNCEAGPPRIQKNEEISYPECSSGETIHPAVLPPESDTFQCNCQLLLREIVHSNGPYMTKLSIRGTIGMFCHGILEINSCGIASDPIYETYEFWNKSVDDVKQFLILYFEERKKTGYTMMENPLSNYYKTLCVGLEQDDILNTDDFLVDSSPASPESTENQGESGKGKELVQKINLSEQRERAGRMGLRDIQDHFHLPIDKAAKRLNFCTTVLKKICRKCGVNRWPFRKVQCIQRKIAYHRGLLNSNDSETRARAQAEIQKLEKELAIVCAPGNQ